MKKVIGIIMVLTFVLLSIGVNAKQKYTIYDMPTCMCDNIIEPDYVKVSYGYPHIRYVVITEHDINVYQQDWTGNLVQTHNIIWDNPFI